MKFEQNIHPTTLRSRLSYDTSNGFFVWRKFEKAVAEWRAANEGKRAEIIGEHGYLIIPISGRLIKAHRAAVAYMTGEWPALIVDHIDRDRANNRFSNLRVATASQNAANRSMRRDNTTGFKGVYHEPKRQKPYKAAVTADGKQKHLGYFATAEAASQAYMVAAKEAFGVFATDGKSF